MAFGKVSRRGVCGMALLGVATATLGRTAPARGGSEADALHLLNRLGYGPAPGDLAHLQTIGIERYIDAQLHPETLPLPADLRRQLDALGSSHLSQRELIAQFREAARAAREDGEEGRARRREVYQRITLEAGEARLLSAIESPRQLQESMIDFWFNHFNVFVGKGLDRVLVESYEREAIRPHAMGRFRDLLGATAKHPAMLFYLDNWLSTAPGYQPPRLAGPAGKSTGLNENYARELMELHTLGVDAGYTQQDVTELARMLTGWTFNPRAGSGDSVFAFDARRHDAGDKEWLGRHVAAGGQAEGEFALDALAAHPATARHIAFQLAQYFVADAPPPALVDRLAQRFGQTDGDIGALLKTLFDSAEFRAPQARGVKFKTPYRYVVSTLRAADLPIRNVRPLLQTLYQLGMPLYGCQTPDGYKNTEQAWLNPDAITRRIAFATAFASGRLPLARAVEAGEARGVGPKALQKPAEQGGRRGASDQGDASGRSSRRGRGDGEDRGDPGGSPPRFDPAWATPPVDAEALLAALGDAISSQTRAAVARTDPALRAALVLGSPDFMRH